MVSPVATITYKADVAPHLERGMMYRRMRMQRWQALHKHDGAATFWRIALLSQLLFWAFVGYGVHLVLAAI
jgi:hypothetical protein